MAAGRAEERAPTTRTERLAFLLLLTGLVGLGYGATASSFFLSDDYGVLWVVSGSEPELGSAIFPQGWPFFRPLTAATYWLTYQACGLSPLAQPHLPVQHTLLVHSTETPLSSFGVPQSDLLGVPGAITECR